MPNIQSTSDQAAVKAFIERVEALMQEQAALGSDIKDVLDEAKKRGFDPKTIRKVANIRRKSKAVYLEEEALLAQYLQAVSWLATPLGSAGQVGQLERDANGGDVPRYRAISG